MITIGPLSKKTGVKIETIRYYEQIGLMPEPSRKASGHRLYMQCHIDQLCFIKRSRELGFSLNDIRELIGVNDTKPNCEQVYEITQSHLVTIRAKIKDLTKLETRLSSIAKKCEKGTSPDCPIIDALRP